MTDDELLQELQRLVYQPLRDPPPESVAALRAEVARRSAPSPERPWWRQKAAVGAAVFGLLAGAPAAGFAISGAPLPDPVRTAMHAVGLPIDPVRVADTKAAEAQLAYALKDHDEAAIKREAAHLQTCLAGLDGPERARLTPHAEALLDAAAADNDRATPSGNEPRNDQTSDRDSNDQTGSGGQGSITIPDGRSAVPNGSGDDGDRSSTDGSNGSVDGGTATAPASSNQDSYTTVPSSTGGGDGEQSSTSTTTVSVSGQAEGGQATTATVQAGGSGGSDVESGSNDGGSSSSTTTTTTTDTSH